MRSTSENEMFHVQQPTSEPSTKHLISHKAHTLTFSLTHELGPLSRWSEQGVLFGEGLWTPVAGEHQDVRGGSSSAALGPVVQVHWGREGQRKPEQNDEQMLQPTRNKDL